MDIDPDEDLPWPEPDLINKWWSKNAKHFHSGRRYLLGQPISLEWLQDVLRKGLQHQRAAAALELVLKRPGQILFEVRARGRHQKQILGV